MMKTKAQSVEVVSELGRKWMKTGEKIYCCVRLVAYASKAFNVAFRLDGREGLYRVDRKTLGPWESIDSGRGVTSIAKGKSLVSAYVRAMVAEETLHPRRPYYAVHGGTGFTPLSDSERTLSSDDFCCCMYCSPEPRKSGECVGGVWDTLATDLATGKTWKVHYPELHGRKSLRSTHT